MSDSIHDAQIIYQGLTVEFIRGGYFCKIPASAIQIDADGAPNAYGPARFAGDKDGCGIDSLINAGYPTAKDDPIHDNWRDILVPDPKKDKEPFLKKDGFYISKTSLCDESLESDQSPGKFIDAGQVSYMVMPQFWIDHLGVDLGDLCLLWHARLKVKVVAIIGDTCPDPEPLGEISIAAATALGANNVSPKTGADFPGNGSIYCYIFKNSREELEWPLTNQFVQSFKAKLEALIDE